MGSTISLKSAGGWVDHIRVDMQKAGMKAALSAAMLGVRNIQSVIIPSFAHPPVNRGTFKAGWKFEKTDKGARVYNRVYPQSPLIEFGVRGANVKIGYAMIIALMEWVTMKGLGFKNPDDTLKSVAWAIAKSMKRRGIFNLGSTEGFHIIDQAIPAMQKEFVRAYKSFVDKGLGQRA